eukprot:ANDGO_05997.mRNA.1 Gamma-soluble NSF attachment protein
MNAERLAEAEKLFKEGKKYGSKSITRWKPDWDNASQAYEKAALAFRNLKALERAIEAFDLAADANDHANLSWAAGKAYENAAMCCKDVGDLDRLVAYFEKAARAYRLDGKPDKAGDVLKRAAQYIEKTNMEKACDLYKNSLACFVDEDKQHLAAESFRWWVSLLVKSGKLRDAAEAYAFQIPVFIKVDSQHNVGKAVLAQVILCLKDGDISAADQYLRKATEYQGSDAIRQNEYELGVELVQAFEDGDEERLNRLRTDQAIGFLETEVARLGKNLKLVAGAAKVKVDGETTEVTADELADGNLL